MSIDKKLIFSMALIVLYGALVPVLGFYVATASFLLAHMYCLGYKKPFVMIGVAILVISVFYLAFDMFLGIVFPHGIIY